MEHAPIDFPEVAGKTIKEMSVQDDPVYGREVLARFTDGTQLSICIAASQSVEARYSREDTPDRPIFIRQE
jgi:hypothetical protein